MKRTSKIFCVVLCFAIMLTGIAYAAEPQTNVRSFSADMITVVTFSDAVTQETLAAVANGVHAERVDENGNEQPITCTAVVRALPRTYAAEATQRYEVTAYATADDQKSISDSGTTNTAGIECTARITMIWTDPLGVHNTIDRLYGGVTFTRGSSNYQGSTLAWGYNHLRESHSIQYSSSVTSFDYTLPQPYVNSSLHACYTVKLKGITDLRVSVDPTIFD